MEFKEWQTVSLTELYSISSGLSKKRSDFGFGSPFLTFKEVFHNIFLPDELNELANTTEKEQVKCSILRGDVFLTRTSEKFEELGLSSVSLKDYSHATFNGFTKRLRPNNKAHDELMPEYAAFYFRTNLFRNQMESLTTMSTRASLNNEMISKLSITYPSLSKQKSIVDILLSIHEKINVNNKVISSLEQLAQILFKRWFVDFEFPNENGDPYKSSGGEMVESELGRIPANWTIEKLGDVTEIQNGFAFKSKDYVKDGIKVLRTLNIDSAGMIINNDDLKYLPQAFYSDDKYQKQQLKRFDSLLVMVGSTIGKLGLVLSKNLPSLQNQNMWRFRSKNPELSNTILYFYLKEVIIATENWRSGSAREFFRKDSFSGYEIVMPDDSFLISNQNAFVKIFEQIDGCNSQNEVLNELRDILLPKLLSGEIELPEETEVIEDVPIS